MTYHVARGSQQLGIFSLEDVRAKLASGEFLLSDLAWTEGMAEWQAFSSLPGAAGEAPPRLPLPPTMPAVPQLIINPKTSPTAIWSLVLGIGSMVCGCFTGLPAIVLGIMSLKAIKASNGTLGGRGLAIAGICCGGALMITGMAVMAGLALPAFNVATQNARMSQASNNARQIILALKAHAADNNGAYPDAHASSPQTANDAFRIQFQTGILEDESIFGSPTSPFVPDGNIGSAPDFSQALEAGENHWCLTKGLTDSSDGIAPLILENPVATSWPPTWNCDLSGQPVDGRAWKGGKVIIGFNDGSVSIMPLVSKTGDNIGLQNDPFRDDAETAEFLDVLR